MTPEPNPLKRYTVHLDEHEDGEYYLVSDVQELLKDKARLDWLIKQGPPGATSTAWLSDEAWDLATQEIVDVDKGPVMDAELMRLAIDAAMKKGTP